MSGTKTTYFANAVQQHFLKTGAAVAQPIGLYLALFTTDPGIAGSFTNELPNANGYQRMAITFGAPSNGVSSNTVDILWPAYTGTNSPAVTYVGLVDSPTIGAGNMYHHAPSSPSQTLAQNAQYKIAAGAFTDTES